MVLSCEEARKAISARLDGEFVADGPQVDAHLAGCGACAAWQRQVAQLAVFVDRLLLECPPPTERLLAAVRDGVAVEVLFLRRAVAALGVIVGVWAAAGLFPGAGSRWPATWEAALGAVLVATALQSSATVAHAITLGVAVGALAVIVGHDAVGWTATARHLLLLVAAWASWRLGRLLRVTARFGAS